MSKITFRADDDLVERLEACDASKSEVMREALRRHLDEVVDAGPSHPSNASDASGTSDRSDASQRSDATIDAAVTERVDDLIADRLDAALAERLGERSTPQTPQTPPEPTYTRGNAGDINVHVTLDAPGADVDDQRVTRETTTDDEAAGRKTRANPARSSGQTRESACGGCGESVPENHVYCPNCGEKQSHRAFCECGDEIRTDWAFCPGCGRRTPAADVLKDR
ncbi:hypothetical protein C461_01277 [Halorubrum aidingense JCM 13560]|uniref:DZANK-type domain-containing protein n=1 Tax=Halorubrum aidingense JCM 13560 TaxID=1230454 RepID=M0PJV8_9EURY|nr:zinc ribbon domain-containing protein [Halorubrum aidingense]EMA70228.1 hypothetical protein C461_01277 [Halorubrum aidingense JCM 13560]